jgi:type II secretory pathway pseudopilin PulG
MWALLLPFQTAALGGPFVFSLDNRPQQPISIDPIAGPGVIQGNGAEDPYGQVVYGPPPLAQRVGPSPSLQPNLSDADILIPGVAGPQVNALRPIATNYIDEISSNRAPAHLRPLRLIFSVDRASDGLHESGVRDQFDKNQQSGDLFLSDGLFAAPGGFLGLLPLGGGWSGIDLPSVGSGTTNKLLLNQSRLKLRAGSPPGVFVDSTVDAPEIEPGTHDNVDGFDIGLADTSSDQIVDKDMFFSVNPSQPGFNPFYNSAASIYRTPAGLQNPQLFAPAATLGLDMFPRQPGQSPNNSDNVDGLDIFDLGPDGVPNGVLDPGIDYALFSLSPGSQTLLNNPGLTAADVFLTDFCHSFARFARDSDLGLSGTANPAELGGPGASPEAGNDLEPFGNDNIDAQAFVNPGDMNWDGYVNYEDVPDFVQGLTRPVDYVNDEDHWGPATDPGDFTPQDGVVDFDDVPPFRLAIAGPPGAGGGHSTPEPGAFPLVVTVLIAVFISRRRAVRGDLRKVRQPQNLRGSMRDSSLRCASLRMTALAANRIGYTIVELLVVVTIISVLLALLMPAIQSAREAARSAQCADHLKQLALATQAYHSSHNEFPSGSTLSPKPLVFGDSWLVYCLPHLEEQELADRILKKREMIAPAIPLFFCPSDPVVIGGPTSLHFTNYNGSGGAGRSAEHVIKLEDQFCGDVYTDGVFYPLSKTAAKNITDGLTHTLAIGERIYSTYIWTAGAYWLGSAEERLCVQGSKNVRWPINSPPSTAGYYKLDKEAPPGVPRTLLMNDLYFGSRHPGGAWFAFAGGNVHFIAEDIAFSVYQDLAARNDGEKSLPAD